MKDKEILRRELFSLIYTKILKYWELPARVKIPEGEGKRLLRQIGGFAVNFTIGNILESEEAQAIFLKLIDAGLKEDSLILCNNLLDKEIESLQERIEKLENTEKK